MIVYLINVCIHEKSSYKRNNKLKIKDICLKKKKKSYSIEFSFSFPHIFIRDRKFLSRFLTDSFSAYKNLNPPPFYPLFFFFFDPPLKNRNLHEEQSTLYLWRVDWSAYLVHSRLKTRPLLAEMDCRVHVSHPLSEGMASLKMEEERLEQVSILFFFFFFTIASCTHAHDTRFPIDRHESLITR